jgi:hypothetical protein
VQIDTSEHDWFEGRGEQGVLIAMIDDATSWALMRFFASDTTASNMTVLGEYLRRYGRPVAVYADRASHFVTTRCATVEEELEGKKAQTQIARALSELGIGYIAARSPQGKGRVERSFKTCQDRLVKQLRLEGIGTIEEANGYVESVFLPWWQAHCTWEPRQPADVHRPVEGFDLEAILSHQETRVVGKDHTVSYKTRRYQIARESIRPGLRRSRVIVEERLDGSIHLRWQGAYLKHQLLETARPSGSSVGLRPSSKPDGRTLRKRRHTTWKPAADHPWRRYPDRTSLHCTKEDIPTLR